MTGKFLVITILLTSFLAGATMYYLQVYGFYAKVDLEESKGISLVNLSTKEPEKLEVVNFQGIDADSSPIRFRACFEIKQSFDVLNEKYTIVKSLLKGTKDRPEVKIDWRIYTKNPENPLIRDLIIEGLSLARTQKEEFASIINSNNGDINFLFLALEEFLKN